MPFCSWLSLPTSDQTVEWNVFSFEDWTNFGYIPDNTLQDGNFIFASGNKKDDYARLVSEKLEPTGDNGVCLSFYFYFSGNSQYNLTVRLAENNKNEIAIWSYQDSQVSDNTVWHQGQIWFETSDIYRIYFDVREFFNIFRYYFRNIIYCK